MAVFVDPLFETPHSITWHWDFACHMFADSLDELHAMAVKIGLRREWFQEKRVPHYDLNASRRAVAIRNGVIQLTREEAVVMWREKGWFPTRDSQNQGSGRSGSKRPDTSKG